MKQFLKNVTPLYALNAKIKAHQLKKQYRKILSYYEAMAKRQGFKYSEHRVYEEVAKRLACRGVNIRGKTQKNLGILFVGSDESQDTGGFLQSLEMFGKVHLFRKGDGRYGHYFYGHGRFAEKKRLENGKRLIEIIKTIRKDGESIDLVLGQMWGRTMPWRALKEVQEMGVVTVNICMDDRHSFRRKNYRGGWMGTLGLVKGLDLSLTSAPEACLWFELEGCPAIFWPEASDPAIFRPMDVPKKYDVSFVGGNYGIREKVVRAIENRGVKVECYGNGWPNGRIPTTDVPELFASSKIILGVGTIGHCEDFYSLKLRDFDATLSGGLYLTHNNPDLHLLFEVGKEIVTYRKPEECAEKVVYYLEHSDEREAIARAGLERALSDHTLEKRFERLFRVLGLETCRS